MIFATGLAGSGDVFRSGEGVNSEWDFIKQETLYDFQLVSNPCGERKHVSYIFGEDIARYPMAFAKPH